MYFSVHKKCKMIDIIAKDSVLCWIQCLLSKETNEAGKTLLKVKCMNKTQEILDEIQGSFGMVPNFFQAQADTDSEMLASNWTKEKEIMLSGSVLDRKTKELLAMTVSIVNNNQYCSLAHETMAMMVGATSEEIAKTKQIIKLFKNFNTVADDLKIPCDITPAMLAQS